MKDSSVWYLLFFYYPVISSGKRGRGGMGGGRVRGRGGRGVGKDLKRINKGITVREKYRYIW